MNVKIKICGITRQDDARIAANLGVDALGFIFHEKSLRAVSAAAARAIIETLPPLVTRVGVFVDQTPQAIHEIAEASGINAVQLHGSESAECARAINLPVIKACAIKPGFNLDPLQSYPASAFLLDTWNGTHSGGTGMTFDWRIARQAVNSGLCIMLAGGLGPANLREALDEVHPYGVDVNSGVEIRPGEKNPQKMRDAIRIVREWKPS